jgi:hypothetical protein
MSQHKQTTGQVSDFTPQKSYGHIKGGRKIILYIFFTIHGQLGIV